MKTFASLLALAALLPLVASHATAFHGAWWTGSGTATNKDGSVYGLEFHWSGQDFVLQCGGEGCQGGGDGYLVLEGVAATLSVKYPFEGIEDVRDVMFTSDPDWCPGEGMVQVVPDHRIVFDGGAVQGVQRNCISNGMNNSDYTGVFLTFDLAIHSEGAFGVTHG